MVAPSRHWLFRWRMVLSPPLADKCSRTGAACKGRAFAWRALQWSPAPARWGQIRRSPIDLAPGKGLHAVYTWMLTLSGAHVSY
jgi:hypothetical protein